MFKGGEVSTELKVLEKTNEFFLFGFSCILRNVAFLSQFQIEVSNISSNDQIMILKQQQQQHDKLVKK